MRINNQKLKRVELLRPERLAGADIKDEERFLQVLREEQETLRCARELRTLWRLQSVTDEEELATKNILKLIDCLE